jgi:hypothetical protein
VKNKFAVVTAVLRLSTKYLATKLRHCAVLLLTTAYPTELNTWNRRDISRIMTVIAKEFGALVAPIEQTEVHVILPALFCSVAKQPIADVFAELCAALLSDSVRQEIVTVFIVGRENL